MEVFTIRLQDAAAPRHTATAWVWHRPQPSAPPATLRPHR
eukprot:CAMPEP_0118823622 /NCGR_PEP_ID=MMETSP1162-20130426/10036_1 /TAXON_ID=33656 /ORGANISM="Phaeocystis Sp, Strain CCMP2710" /LENGTH=39 /DNA_ID= /DNA_START= /DNA_END= /DNA_ORIENTATION=